MIKIRHTGIVTKDLKKSLNPFQNLEKQLKPMKKHIKTKRNPIFFKIQGKPSFFMKKLLKPKKTNICNANNANP